MRTFNQLIFPIILLCILTMCFTNLNAQNVGINTLTPQMPLHVKSLTSEMEVLRLESANQYGSFLSIWNNMERKGFLGIVNNENDIKLGTYITGGKIQFMTEITNPAMTILSDGKVGIGTENPTELLDLDGNLNLGGQIKLYGVAGLAGQVLQSDGSGNMSWTTMSGGSTDAITDADGDTKIQVEEFSDEDIIRFDAGGIEIVTIGDGFFGLTSIVNQTDAIGVKGQSNGSGYAVGGTFTANTSLGTGVRGTANGTNGKGVFGTTTGTSGRAVEGLANGSTGQYNYGGYFASTGSNGRGVFGRSTGTSGRAMEGIALSSGSGTNYGGYFSANGSLGRGVHGTVSGTTGRAVEGIALSSTTSATNYGGYFSANGNFGRGVHGTVSGISGRAVEGIASSSVSGTNYGGYFSANGSLGVGVYGEALGQLGRGVFGDAYGDSGMGVWGAGNGSNSIGVRGIAYGESGYGMLSSATGTFGIAVSGTAEGSAGIGVEGKSYNGVQDTTNYGGRFSAYGVQPVGARGFAEGLNSFGLKGYALGTNAIGVHGEASGTNTYAGYFQGDVHVTGNFTNPSDIRFKKNIVRDQKFLNKLMRLDPVTYEFDTDKFKAMNFSKGVRHGFIAQELELVYPELVSNKKHQINKVYPDSKEVPIYKEFKSVNYIDLIPDLVGAIQEQQEIIQKQQEFIALLKVENQGIKNELLHSSEKQNTLEARLEALEQGSGLKK